MKVFVLAAMLSVLVGSQVLADGRDPVYTSVPEFQAGQQYLVYSIFSEGIDCLQGMGLYDDAMPSTADFRTQYEFGRCIGYFDAAEQFATVFPQETSDRLWITHYDVLLTAAYGYSDCLGKADTCSVWGMNTQDWIRMLRDTTEQIDQILWDWYAPTACAIPGPRGTVCYNLPP